MKEMGIQIAQAAQELVGTKFRLHGRNPLTGLDCVGLVAASLTKAGAKPVLPIGYSLRNTSTDQFIPFAAASGLEPASGTEEAGDVLMVRVGPAQLHLVIAMGGHTFVHADAGLRRVTRLPAPMDWHVLNHWRYQI